MIFFLVCLDMLFGILLDILFDISCDILSDISSNILSDTLSDISCDLLSDILFAIFPDILSDIFSDILTDISSDILSDIFPDILSHIFSDILFDISSDIHFDTFFDILSDILSGISPDILRKMSLTKVWKLVHQSRSCGVSFEKIAQLRQGDAHGGIRPGSVARWQKKLLSLYRKLSKLSFVGASRISVVTDASTHNCRDYLVSCFFESRLGIGACAASGRLNCFALASRSWRRKQRD